MANETHHFSTLEVSDQELYDLLGEAIHDMKKDFLKAQTNFDVLNKKMLENKLAGKPVDQQGAMGNAMLGAQVSGLPVILAEMKQRRFEVFERLKKANAAPAT